MVFSPFLFQVGWKVRILNALLVIAKNKLSYPARTPPVSAEELFSCSLSQETRGFHVSVIDPCCSSAAWWHAAVQSSANTCPSYEKKSRFPYFPSQTTNACWFALCLTEARGCIPASECWLPPSEVPGWVMPMVSQQWGLAWLLLGTDSCILLWESRILLWECCSCSPAPGLPREIYWPHLLATG